MNRHTIRSLLFASIASALALTGCSASSSQASVLYIQDTSQTPSIEAVLRLEQTRFSAGPGLSLLDSDAASYSIPKHELDMQQLESLRDLFKIKDAFVAQSEEMGSGYAAGSLDFGTSPYLSIMNDAAHSWWYKAPSETLAYSSTTTDQYCEKVEPQIVGESANEYVEGDCIMALPPDTPKNLPSTKEVENLFKDLLGSLGYKFNDFVIETWSSEWNIGMRAYLKIDGVRSPLTWSVAYGDNAVLEEASGVLSEPTKADRYPRIGTKQALERLSLQWNGQKESGHPYGSTTKSPETPEETKEQSENSTDHLVLAEDLTEIIVSIVEEELVSLTGLDGSMYLVPGYAFIVESGYGQSLRYTVSAISDTFTSTAMPTTE